MSRSLLSELNDQLAHPKPNVAAERRTKKTAKRERRSKFHFDVLIAAGKKCENPQCVSILKRDVERLHAHHIIYRSDGGPDKDCNGLALCPTCHSLAHLGVENKHGRQSGRQFVYDILTEIKRIHPERWRWDEAYETLKRILENKHGDRPD